MCQKQEDQEDLRLNHRKARKRIHLNWWFLNNYLEPTCKMLHCKRSKMDGLLLLIDFWKAFDIIDHEWIYKTIESPNFGKTYSTAWDYSKQKYFLITYWGDIWSPKWHNLILHIYNCCWCPTNQNFKEQAHQNIKLQTEEEIRAQTLDQELCIITKSFCQIHI